MREYKLDMSHSAPCEHRTERVELTPDGPHYGKRICLKCGKFMGWEKDPRVSEQVQNRDARIDMVLRKGASPWEQGFLNNIKGKRFLTKKQEECLDLILMRLK